ncbi:hypothetical protein, unlikely [Trypanosoma brucei gambiense DAL972]|uniref:T. brucei spp.-specific protein n=1 Tax=Trypanosoma brucei gambiense (strain MHOM/CI/86/DAL972) TaxID=679716 RepID=C9ZSS3_TRYB9|nr:hypothetical protein, unlikely [Trypanosoma brucei gambiense DAL972]CBH12457.1 hypothetical protein, unlikely [Trypanosoma brucei gambiense DAL972]|eukprot:XP_011774738.1 hypothetical protein, unlikely [Trypanosoma brucei gambiense DAL972]
MRLPFLHLFLFFLANTFVLLFPFLLFFRFLPKMSLGFEVNITNTSSMRLLFSLFLFLFLKAFIFVWGFSMMATQYRFISFIFLKHLTPASGEDTVKKKVYIYIYLRAHLPLLLNSRSVKCHFPFQQSAGA